MELCLGTLADYFDRKLLDIRLTAPNILWQILSGLEYLHQNNLVHGSLKSCSVLVDNKSEVTLKITGFSVLTQSVILTRSHRIQTLC